MLVHILASLLAAHVLGDFVLQTRRDVQEKRRPAILLKHGGIHALLSYVLVGLPTAWLIPVAVLLSHTAIDYIKTRVAEKGLVSFVADQAAHVLALVAVAGAFTAYFDVSSTLWLDAAGPLYARVLVVLTGLIITVRTGAFFVDMAVEPFLRQIKRESITKEHVRGLHDGGRTIGQLERALIFVFVLVDQFTAIGFLIAAKSIFRFGELRERSNRVEAEYIIIGTLISFLWAIVVALITRALAI